MSFSAQSSSSMGSGIESLDSDASSRAEPADNDDLNSGDVEVDAWNGPFSVLFAVSKERCMSWSYAWLRIFLEWLQVLIIIVNPRWGWHINADNSWWQTFSFLRLEHSALVRGYLFTLIVMYMLIAALMVVTLGCAWAGHGLMNNDFKSGWVLVVIRYFRRIFLQLLDVAAITLLLIPFDCHYFGVEPEVQGRAFAFPDVYCWEMPHVIHMLVSGAAICVYLVLAAAFVMADLQPNPVGQAPLGMAHTRVELYGFGIKMLMACSAVFLSSLPWMSVALFISAFLLCYLYLRWLPHQFAIVNHLRVGAYFSICWAALMYIMLAYHPGNKYGDTPAAVRQKTVITIVMWVGLLPAAALGALLSKQWTAMAIDGVFEKFSSAPTGVKDQSLHTFTDAREIEVASRACRIWLEADGRVLDPESVAVVERIVQAGVRALPRQPYARLLWAAYLIDVLGAYHLGYAELKEARRMSRISLLERFMVYCREQEHILNSMALGSADEVSTDLAGYVEHQRDFKMTLQLHREALLSNRAFWVVLQHRNATLAKVAAAVQRIEKTVRAAERMYRQVLQRHASSLDLLLLYVKFQQGVRNDAWSAAHWAAEAEKLQRAEEEANQRAMMAQSVDSATSKKAIIVMGANCVMRMVNEAAAELLGYSSPNDLVGRSVNLIIPPPFSRDHNSYVRTYIETGVARVMNVQRELVALHRDSFLVPIQVYLSKVSGIGEESVFTAIFEASPAEPGVASAWVMYGNTLMSCDQAFTDWFGYKHDTIHGQLVAKIMVNPARMEEMLATIREATNPAMENGMDKTEMLIRRQSSILASRQELSRGWKYNGNVKHMYTDAAIPVDVSIVSVGVGPTALLRFRFKRLDSITTAPLLLVTNTKGGVVHATSSLAKALGTTTQALQAEGAPHALDALLPPPYQRLHHQYCRDRTDTLMPWSCRAGLTMCLFGRDDEGVKSIPFFLNIKRKDVPGREPVTVVRLEQRTHEQLLDERRLIMLVDKRGIVSSVGASPASLFNFEPTGLVGTHMAYVLDVFQPWVPCRGQVTPEEIVVAEEQAAKVIVLMAERSFKKEGMCWRVGVTPVIDPTALMGLGSMGQAMIAEQKVAAVMVVRPHIEGTSVKGAVLELPHELLFQIELWRADRMGGVLDVDPTGIVLSSGIKDVPASSPHLLLGLPAKLVIGAHISSLLPCGRNHADTLFTDNSMVSRARARGAAPAAGAVRSVLRAGVFGGRRHVVGPVHIVRVQHGTDRQDLELQVQAVVKQNLGAACSLHVMLHLKSPKCGDLDFLQGLIEGPDPHLPLPLAGNTGSRAASDAAHRNPDKLVGTNSRGVPGAAKGQRDSVSDAHWDGNLVHPGGGPQLSKDKATRFREGFEPPEDAAKPAAPHRFERKPTPVDGIDGLRMSSLDTDDANKAMQAKAPGTGVPAISGEQEPGSDRGTPDGQAQGDSDQGDRPGEESDEGDVEDAQEEADSHIQDEHQDMDSGAGFMDSGGMADHKRGKRLKRLTKAIMSPASQQHALNLRRWSLAMVVTVIVVDVCMYSVFSQLLEKQRMQVQDLRSTSRAVNRVMQIAISMSGLQVLMENGPGYTSPIRHMGLGGYDVDVAYTLSSLEAKTIEMDAYHRGVYRGFHSVRQLPDVYGLRQLWEQPSVETRVFYQAANGSCLVNITVVSLWDAGNMYIQAARSLIHNVLPLYGGPGQGALLLNDTNALFIQANAPRGLMSAYQATLDAMMRNAVDASKRLNEIQLVILAVEGVAVGILAVVVVWIFSTKAVFRRYAVFTLFMMVPSGVVRTLASAPLDLGIGSKDDDQEAGGDEPVEGAEGEHEAELGGLHGPNQGAQQHTAGDWGPSKIGLGVKLSQQQAATQVAGAGDRHPALLSGGCWAALLARVCFWRGQTARAGLTGSSGRRRLQPSTSMMLTYTWPFMLWMVVVIVLNSIAYNDLSNMSAPIALSNMVQFLSVRVNRVLLMSQRYASKQYFAPGFVGIAPVTVAPDEYNPNSAVQHAQLLADYPLLRIQYDAMLYGGRAPAVLEAGLQDEPHFALATLGAEFTDGAYLLYDKTGCLAQSSQDCYQPTDEFYAYTEYGLDQSMKHLFVSVEKLLVAKPIEISMNNPEVKYICEVGMGHITGGLVHLTNIYSTFVDDMYQKALLLHIVALVLVISLSAVFILFVLRPAHAHLLAESRRVAQLLASLPAELDVEGMLACTLLVQSTGRVDVQTQLEAAVRAKEAARAATLTSVRKQRSL